MTKSYMLPIGISDFNKLIKFKNPSGANYCFIDKSMLIKDVMDEGADVLIFPRPRRFGKTLNLSMLRNFFSKTVLDLPTYGLFDSLAIAKHPEYMQHQGRYPIIYITFKDEKFSNLRDFEVSIGNLIVELYANFDYLLKSDALSNDDKNKFERILKNEANKIEIYKSVAILSRYLYQHHKIKPIILIDEYDTPIQHAFLYQFYDECIDIMRTILGTTLKDNRYIEKAILTGIVRVSKESLFSGLNNIKIFSSFNKKFAQYFGFLEDEVNLLLDKFDITTNKSEIRNWYNGYKFGDNQNIYNPWSILNCIAEEGALKAYWVNTSGNDIIKHLINKSSETIKTKIQKLLQGESINARVNEHLVYTDLNYSESAIWSLLLLTGYLKPIKYSIDSLRYDCELAIPNKELYGFFKYIIQQWFSGHRGEDLTIELMQDLTRSYETI